MNDTLPIQGRISIISFANLAKAYEIERVPFRSKSDILWRAVEQLSIMYRYKLGDELTAFETIEDAVNYLSSIGIELGSNNRARRTVEKRISTESYFLETGELPPKPLTMTQIRKTGSSGVDMATIRQRAEEIARSQSWQHVEVEGAEVSPSLLSPEERAERTAEEDRLMKQKQKEAIMGMKREKEE
jgi:hypothetical protein